MDAATRRRVLVLGGAAGLAAAAVGAFGWSDRLPGPGDIAAAYAVPLAPPEGAMRVFHLGHSLVGRDMPAMLAQLAGPGHLSYSQLGWGTPLAAHWDLEVAIQGFDAENDHPHHRPARAAVGSGTYDAVILTEMIALNDAIRYHDSGAALARWADLARGANARTRVYLYETWHPLDDPAGFLERLDADLPALWEGRLLARDLAARPSRPVHVIPAGQVMARVVRAAEAAPVPGLARREDLFARTPEGGQDMIHMSDLGAYLVAITHYAVLYHRTPVGLSVALNRADGSPAVPPTPEAAALMQNLAWDVVTGYSRTGVAG